MTNSLVAALDNDAITGWGKRPLRLSHFLHTSPLFTDEALADLIERYPSEHYGLLYLGGKERAEWREGAIGRVSGREVIDVISKGSLWLNLRAVMTVDPAYKALGEKVFAELREQIDGFDPTWLNMGILISSPSAKIQYHADMPGQALFQIRGKKRVFVYPAEAPYLTPEGLENIALEKSELSLAYDPSYDQNAKVFELEPGQWLHWPLNAPHRVDNHDCLNVSVTFEYLTSEIRRHQIVTSANGILRRQLHITPRSSGTAGAGYWSKALLHAGMRRSGMLALKTRQTNGKTATFTLAPGEPEGIQHFATSP